MTIKPADNYPKNKEHFLKLMEFGKEIIEILQRAGVTPVIYGSFAHFTHTKDTMMNVNDIDILIPENSFKKIIKDLKKRRIKYNHSEEWHTMSAIKRKLRVEFDSIEFWYKDRKKNQNLPKDFEDFIFQDKKVKIISLNSLKKLYKIAYERSTENKEKILKKMRRLEKNSQ